MPARFSVINRTFVKWENMMKAIVITFITSFLFQGCIITNTPGFHSGYKKLTPEERKQIKFLSANEILPNENSKLIFAINAQSLLRSIQQKDTTLVYVWAPHCHSSGCISLISAQQACDNKGYNLVVVAEYYDIEEFSRQPILKNPLFIINHKYYKTDYCPKYSRLFSADLRQGIKLPDSTKYSRYYMFKGSKFIGARNFI